MKKLLFVFGLLLMSAAYGYDYYSYSYNPMHTTSLMNPVNPNPVAAMINPVNIWHDTYYGSSKKHSTKSLVQICLEHKGGKACHKRDCEFYHGKDYCRYKECVKYGGGKACNSIRSKVIEYGMDKNL